jgi:hypothetical protein
MIKKIIFYLNPFTLFKKHNDNVNMRLMNGMNRIAIYAMIIGLGVVVKRILFP